MIIRYAILVTHIVHSESGQVLLKRTDYLRNKDKKIKYYLSRKRAYNIAQNLHQEFFDHSTVAVSVPIVQKKEVLYLLSEIQ